MTWKIYCRIRSYYGEQVASIMNNGPIMFFITHITTEWAMERGMLIFRYTLRKIYCSICLKQTIQQSWDGALTGNCHFHCASWTLCSTELDTHHTSASQSIAPTVMTAYPEVLPVLNRLFVLWEHSSWEQTTAEQWGNSQRALCCSVPFIC